MRYVYLLFRRIPSDRANGDGGKIQGDLPALPPQRDLGIGFPAVEQFGHHLALRSLEGDAAKALAGPDGCNSH